MSESSEPNVTTAHAELVPNQPAALSVPLGTPIHLCPSTLPADEAGVIRRLNAMGQSTLDLDRNGELLITVQDVLVYPREQVDEATGEVSQFSWIVLIDPNGERWGTSSAVVGGKLWQLLALRSAKLIKWPVSLQIVTRTARKTGRRYHDVVVLRVQDASNGPSGSVDHEPRPEPVARPRNKK